MKPVRVLLSVMIAAVILFAPLSSVYAIGFDAEEIYNSVFVIYSGNALGSGFSVSSNCIITNAHVIQNKNDVTVCAYNGAKYRSKILGIDTAEDIAVLYVDNADFPYLDVADFSACKPGDDIYAIGAPKGMAYTLTKGSISAKNRFIGNNSYIQIDAPINEGNSGGPLLNDNGQVLGVNTMKMSDSEGIGLAIPMERVCDYMEALGIHLNSSENSNGEVTIPIPTPVIQTEPEREEDTHKESPTEEILSGEEQSPALYIAWGIAILSLIGNVVLTILLIYEKNKDIKLPNNSSERTDFDIDVWE